ncbi:TPA: helix-turn-helix domain-containing protein, partial [Klebsiella pneumoniae]
CNSAVILTPVDGIIRWLPRGFSCSPAGLASARARGRNGGRPYKMTPVKLRLAMASMGQSETKVSTLCQELGITRQTLYRHISPVGQLRADGIKLLNRG